MTIAVEGLLAEEAVVEVSIVMVLAGRVLDLVSEQEVEPLTTTIITTITPEVVVEVDMAGVPEGEASTIVEVLLLADSTMANNGVVVVVVVTTPVDRGFN